MELPEAENIELGDWVTIYSIRDTVNGDVIYRSDKLIRVKPKQVSDRATDFPLNEDGDFDEDLGVYLVQIHQKSDFYHFAAMIGVQPGEDVDFFTTNGEEAAPPGTVLEVITTDTEDALILTDGRRIDFQCIGPEPPIAVIRPANRIVESEENALPFTSEQQETDRVAEEEPSYEELLREILPSASIEEIPTAERFYPDAVQRQEMYSDFLEEFSAEQQKNPKLLRSIASTTEYILALKQSTVKLDVGGRPIGYAKSSVDSLEDIVSQSRLTSIPASVPVYDVQRSIFLDQREDGSSDSLKYNYLLDIEVGIDLKRRMYEDNIQPAGDVPFFSYLDSLFRVDGSPFPNKNTNGEAILYTQEAFIAPPPGESRPGFEAGLPAGQTPTFLLSKKGTTAVTTDYITSVNVRTGRFVPAVRASGKKFAPTLLSQPADLVNVAGYVLMDAENTLRARTINNVPSLFARMQLADLQSNDPVYLGDIDAVEIANATTDSTALYIREDQIKQTTPEFWETWIRNSLRRTLSPIHAFGPASTQLAMVMDSYVPSRCDLPNTIQDEIWELVEQNINLLRSANAATRTRILEKLANPPEGTKYSSLVQSQLPFGRAVFNDNIMHIIADKIKEREASFPNNPHIMMNDIVKVFKTEAAVYYTNLIARAEGREPAIDYDMQKQRLLDIIRSEKDADIIAEATNKSLESEPDINTCEHNQVLRLVRSGKEGGKSMQLLQQFLADFQGERDENWITCNLCNNHCVCMHEVMMLNEWLHPGRGAALHKQILLGFGGPVFQGHYICKNCGQGISELEYDNHLEFDDDGKPMTGRSTVKPEDDEGKLNTDIDLKKIMSEHEITFAKEEDTKLYKIARVISERAGMNMTETVYRRIIRRVGVYLERKVPTRELYERQIVAAKAKGTRAKFPIYEELRANQQVAAVAAMVLFELQTSDPPIIIMYPFLQCPFSIDGFPLAGMSPGSAGNGALNYISCCVSSIVRTEDPWANTEWALLTDLERRKNKILSLIERIFIAMVGSGQSGVPLPISAELIATLDASKERLRVIEGREKPSSKDKLPTTYLPSPFVTLPESVSDVAIVEDPNPVVLTAPLQNLSEINKDLSYRLKVIFARLQQEAHNQAEAQGLLILTSERSDSFCCSTPLADVRKGSLQRLGLEPLEKEASVISQALRKIHGRTPTSTFAGTHIWTPWAARRDIIPDTRVPENIFYKLFLRNCFRGPEVGKPHKLGFGNACRNCGFIFPASPDIVDAETQGKPALEAQGVDTSEKAFEAILSAKREKSTISPTILPPVPEIIDVMQKFATEAITGPAEEAMWNAATTIMQSISQVGTGTREEVRDAAWANFVSMYDLQKENLRSKLVGSSATRRDADVKADKFLSSLDLLTVSPLRESPDNLLNIIVSRLMQRATGFKLTNVDAARWFRVDPEHNNLLNSLMADYSASIGEASAQGRVVANRIANELGVWLRRWKKEIYEDLGAGFSEAEARYLLRFQIVRMLNESTDSLSYFYRDLPRNAEGEPPTPEAETVMRETTTFIMTQVEFGAKTSRSLSEKEIQEQLQHRTELEKNYIIGIFDKLDDEEQDVEKILKKLGIGKWSVGTLKNLYNYSPEMYEHERQQRAAMGIAELPAGLGGAENANMDTAGAAAAGRGTTAADFGLFQFGVETQRDRGYDVGDDEGRGYDDRD